MPWRFFCRAGAAFVQDMGLAYGTGMTATEAVTRHLSDHFRDLFLKHIPISRMGLPEEIAAAVVYFAGDESAYTTGQILSVSGGFGLATPLYGELSGREMRR